MNETQKQKIETLDEIEPCESTSFIRWQDKSIDQVGTTSSLILGLSTGILAITFAIIAQPTVDKSAGYIWSLYLFPGMLILAIAFGIAVAVNRSLDYRLTAQIARAREKKLLTDEELEPLRAESREYGKKTWWFYKAQLFVFCISAGIFVSFIYFYAFSIVGT